MAVARPVDNRQRPVPMPESQAMRKAVYLAASSIDVVIRELRRHLDRLQVTMRTVGAANDPSFIRWAEEMRQAVVNGSIQKQIAQQRDPAELVESYRRNRSGDT